MRTLTRRHVLAAAAAVPALQAKPLTTIGVQLYTVRSVLGEKPLEILKAIEQIGFQEVEAVRASLPQIWDALKQTALKPVSVHLDTPLFTQKLAELPAAIDDVAKKGFRYAVCPYVAPGDRGADLPTRIENMKKLGASLTKAGEKCRAAGLTLAYHNHAFEFEPAGGGRTLLDILMAESDPRLVHLEMDIMWVAVGGGDAVKLLSQYKGRVPLMHVKDVHTGVPVQYNERIPRDKFAEAGQGTVKIPAVLSAARKLGVKHFFVEQDQTPGDPLASLRISYGYLSKLSV
ncbi:MAG: sugar phosphate isomerase/epimerase [Bryobacteraceae bacterium]